MEDLDQYGLIYLLEFQWSDVKFEENKCKKILPKVSRLHFDEDLNLFTKYLEESKSPLFVLGYGCILSGMEKKIKNFIEENDFRCVTTWTAGGIFSTKVKITLGLLECLANQEQIKLLSTLTY